MSKRAQSFELIVIEEDKEIYGDIKGMPPHVAEDSVFIQSVPKDGKILYIFPRTARDLFKTNKENIEINTTNVTVRHTTDSGYTSEDTCHYCNESLKQSSMPQELIILQCNNQYREFHLDCYYPFISQLNEFISENTAVIAAHNL